MLLSFSNFNDHSQYYLGITQHCEKTCKLTNILISVCYISNELLPEDYEMYSLHDSIEQQIMKIKIKVSSLPYKYLNLPQLNVERSHCGWFWVQVPAVNSNQRHNQTDMHLKSHCESQKELYVLLLSVRRNVHFFCFF